jgi:hypothetical protein
MAQCIHLLWFLDVSGSNEKIVKETQHMYKMMLGLTLNFWHRLPLTAEPFMFPSQVTQVFLIENLKKLGWKVVFAERGSF